MNVAFSPGLAQATAKKYVSAGRRYFEWAANNHLSVGGRVPCPSGIDLAFFAVAEARRGVSPSFIEGSISGIGWCFEACGFHNPGRGLTGKPDPILSRVLRGIKRTLAKAKRSRRPFTTDLLKRMFKSIGSACPDLNSSDRVAYLAALSHAVYGLLRASEFCCAKTRTTVEWDARASDVKVCSSAELGSDFFVRTIRKSKTDVFRKSAEVRIFETGSIDCPVRAMKEWLRVRQAGPDAPLFQLNDGTNITRDRLSGVMRACLAFLGLDPKKYAPHSLRKGGAVTLSAAGYGKEAICRFGRWSSDAYLEYLGLSDAMKAAAFVGMASVKDGAVSAADLAVYANRYD